MPKIPQIQHRTEAPGPVGQPKAQAVSSGIEHLGAGFLQVAEIEQKKQQRYDAITGELSLQNMELIATQKWDSSKVEREDGVLAPEAWQEHKTYLDTLAAETVANYKGSELGRLSFAKDVEALRGRLALGTYNEQTKAQHKFMEDRATKLIDQYAEKAAAAPELLPFLLEEYNAKSNSLKIDAPQGVDQLLQEGRSQIIGTVIRNYLETGDPDSAETFMKGEYGEFLDPKDKIDYRIDIAKARKTAKDIKQKLQDKRKIGEEVFGKPWEQLTEDQRAAVHGIRETSTPTDEIAARMNAYRQVYGTMPEGVVLAGIVSGVTGGDVLPKDAPLLPYISKIRLNTMTENDRDAFNSLMTNALEPTYHLDPVAREWIGRIPALPERLVEAMEAAGMDVPPNGVSVPVGAEQAYQPQYAGRLSRSGVASKSSRLVGPIARFMSGVSQTPGLGGIFSDEDKKAAENVLIALRRDLVDFLQNSPKNAERERAEVEQDVKLEAGVWNTSENMENTLLGWYDVVLNSLAEAEKIYMDATSGKGVRPSRELLDKAKNMLYQGPAILRDIGIRRREDMPKDEKAFSQMLRQDPVGTLYFFPENGVVYRKAPDKLVIHRRLE